MRVALARILLMRPTSCCSTSRRTTSTSSLIWLEAFLADFDGAV
jgi:hypothetical protein